MKNLQSYDQFLNEANEEIKAQDACKTGIFSAQREIDKLYKDLLAKGWLSSYKSKVKTWNQGYMIEIDAKQNIKFFFNKEQEKLYNIVNELCHGNDVYLQPGVFFESHFQKGYAKIEAHLLEYKLDNNYFKGSHGVEKTYIDYPVKTKADISNVSKLFLDDIKGIIAGIQEDIKDGMKSL